MYFLNLLNDRSGEEKSLSEHEIRLLNESHDEIVDYKVGAILNIDSISHLTLICLVEPQAMLSVSSF